MLKEIEKHLQKRIEAEKRMKLEERERKKKDILLGFFVGLATVLILLFFNIKLAISFASFFVIITLFFFGIYLRIKLKENRKIKGMEDAFPDFLQLMASNLRAGMTIDKAILLSSRPEFAHLDKEILNVGKDIATGKSIETALLDTSKRIKSKKIEKTILLIISGIKAGGNLAILLEETSRNMREREFVEKRAVSNVLMYIIFIFIAVSVGAPLLFSLSSILVETLITLLSGLPSIEASTNMPFTLSSVSFSINFIKYFSLVFIIVIDILASFVLGLVTKGDEKEGLRFLIPMLAISIIIFFLIRIILRGVMASLFLEF